MLGSVSSRSAVRITLYYLLFGLVWILFSDLAVEQLVSNPTLQSTLQTLKGWGFILLTAALLFYWSRGALLKVEEVVQDDPLTGLSNRNWANKHGQRLIRAQRSFHMAILNLDDFKQLNDSEGHAHGDAVLVKVAKLLAAIIPPGAHVARIGGDEFALFDTCSSKDQLTRTLGEVSRALKKLNRSHADRHPVGASIGVVHFPTDARNYRGLMQLTDIALFHAKRKGKGGVTFYHDQMYTAMNERIAMLKALRRSVHTRSFEIHYQPQIDIKARKITGVEALLRWQHEGSYVSPAVFIPLAEEAGLITDITDIVIDTAIDQLARQQLLNGTLPKVSVNLSAKQFNSKEGIQRLTAAMERHHDYLPYLTFEMTESAVMDNIQDAVPTLKALTSSGAQISIDDFGTGYSSLSMLRQLPIDELKIDRSFINELGQNTHDLVIVNTIIAMAKTMGLSLVAEGVESESQAQLLLSNGCTVMQGYFYAKPMPVEALQCFVETYQASSKATQNA